MAAMEVERIRDCCCHEEINGRRNPQLIAAAAAASDLMLLENAAAAGTVTTHLVAANSLLDAPELLNSRNCSQAAVAVAPAHFVGESADRCHDEKLPPAGQSQNLLKLTMSFMMALNILLFSLTLVFSFQTSFCHDQQQQQQHFVPYSNAPSIDELHAGAKAAARGDELPNSHEAQMIPSSAADVCKCDACNYGAPADCCQSVSECIIDLDHGDPTMYEAYWLVNGGSSSTTVIPGWQRMSYFAARHSSGGRDKDQEALMAADVWFMEHELGVQIRALHGIVGNAITEGRHIVVGTGSTQLFQAALYALSLPEQTKPTSVISAAPFYSSYPVVTDYLRSALFRWAGDATTFKLQKQVSESEEEKNLPAERYIELVTSPNNPDGRIQHAVVNGTGPVIHDLAYYWPQYTPITAPADHDLMLFTLSKCTGHAGTRIGWAIVKDAAVAKRMLKFVELNTIGVSQDSQLRATQILKAVIHGYVHGSTHESSSSKQQQQQQLIKQSTEDIEMSEEEEEEEEDHYYSTRNANHEAIISPPAAAADDDDPAAATPATSTISSQLDLHIQNQKLFHYGHSILSYRWNRLRAAASSSSSTTTASSSSSSSTTASSSLNLLDFSPDHCTFFGKKITPTPAFAWLECKKEVDCQEFLKASLGIVTRSGRHFGVGPEFVRLSMLERSHSFEQVVQRIASCSSHTN